MELLRDDLHYIVSRLPRDLLALLKTETLYLAGGCIRAMVAHEPISDYDLHGGNRPYLSKLARSLADRRHGRIWTTDNAITVLANNYVPVQFITGWLYTSPQSVVDSFDFTICQAIIWYQHDIGRWGSYISADFYPDLASKRLRYTAPIRDEDAGGSILRVLKYLRRGYGIAPESFGRVIARLVRGLIERGLFVDTEPELAQGLTNLMREVDPLTMIEGMEAMEEEHHEEVV